MTPSRRVIVVERAGLPNLYLGASLWQSLWQSVGQSLFCNFCRGRTGVVVDLGEDPMDGTPVERESGPRAPRSAWRSKSN